MTTLNSTIRQCGRVASQLTVVKGLLIRNDYLAIIEHLRDEVFDRLHCGPQGVARRRAGAQHTAWWPGVSQRIHDYVKMCPVCSKFRPTPTEPILQALLPERPR